MDEHWLNHKGDEYFKSMTGINEMIWCCAAKAIWFFMLKTYNSIAHFKDKNARNIGTCILQDVFYDIGSQYSQFMSRCWNTGIQIPIFIGQVIGDVRIIWEPIQCRGGNLMNRIKLLYFVLKITACAWFWSISNGTSTKFELFTFMLLDSTMVFGSCISHYTG